MSRPVYGSPAWLILASLEAAGTCPSEADQLWRGLASPMPGNDPTKKDAPRWTPAANRVLIAQFVRDGLVLELADGRFVAASCALLSQIQEAA